MLAALLFCGGNSARVRRAWQVGAFTPLVSTATAQVWMTALAQPWLSRTAAVWQELSATGARDLLALAELTQLTFLTPDAFIATLE